MPVPSPFHARTAELCESHRWKDWSGYHAVCHFGDDHLPEYFAIRQAAGLLDVSPLFKYRVEGPDAAVFLARVMARDVRKLKVGRVAYCTWCDEHGKVLDDGTVARLGERRFRVTAADPSFAWLARHARGFAVEIEDESQAVAALAIQGPTSRAVLRDACDADLAGLRFFGATACRLDGVDVVLTRTGYTGDLGYEVWCARTDALTVWDALIAAGRAHGLRPIGLDALDMARVEAGFVLNGVDYWNAQQCLTEAQKSTPLELGLGWTVQLDREPFLGSAALRRERDLGPRRVLAGLEIDWPALEALYERFDLPPSLPLSAWRSGVPVYAGRRQIGRATSGSWSPTLKRNLALATLDARHAAEGARLDFEVTVEYERHNVPARVVATPFFDPARKRS
ncbi:MAG TPA: aminomethyltransferase family protein [Planctomycetota bacterium]